MGGKSGKIDPDYYHVERKEKSINFKLFKFLSVPTDNICQIDVVPRCTFMTTHWGLLMNI